MHRKKEPSKNLIAILSIIAAFVWVMVIVIFWLSKNSSDFTNDLGIWVGSIGSIVAIYFVVRNTNKQIENQNKQMHRPFLRIKTITRKYGENQFQDVHMLYLADIEYSKEEKYVMLFHSENYFNKLEDRNSKLSPRELTKYRLTSIEKEHIDIDNEDDTYRIQEFYLKIENCGIGPATNIKFYDCSCKKTYSNFVSNNFIKNKDHSKLYWYGLNESFDEERGIYFSAASIIAKDEEYGLIIPFFYHLRISMHLPPPHINIDNVDFIIIYSDINGNIYYTLINIYISNWYQQGDEAGTNFTVHEYPSDDDNFLKTIKKHNLSLEQIRREYLKNE